MSIHPSLHFMSWRIFLGWPPSFFLPLNSGRRVEQCNQRPFSFLPSPPRATFSSGRDEVCKKKDRLDALQKPGERKVARCNRCAGRPNSTRGEGKKFACRTRFLSARLRPVARCSRQNWICLRLWFHAAPISERLSDRTESDPSVFILIPDLKAACSA